MPPQYSDPMMRKEDEEVDIGMDSVDESISCIWDYRGFYQYPLRLSKEEL